MRAWFRGGTLRSSVGQLIPHYSNMAWDPTQCYSLASPNQGCEALQHLFNEGVTGVQSLKSLEAA